MPYDRLVGTLNQPMKVSGQSVSRRWVAPWTRCTEADPQPRYAEVAAGFPAVLLPSRGMRIPVVFEYAQAIKALSGSDFGQEVPKVYTGPDTPAIIARAQAIVARSASSGLLGTNPPTHSSLRRLLTSSFTRIAAQGYLESTRVHARALLARRSSNAIDVQSEFALPLSVAVLAGGIGIPAEDRDRLLDAIRRIGRDLEPDWMELDPLPAAGRLLRVAKNTAYLNDYFTNLVLMRQSHRTGDWLCDLTQRAQGMEAADIGSLASHVFGAAPIAIASLITRSAQLLGEHPEQCRAMVDGGLTRSSFIEEVLRYDPPIHFVRRVALRTTVVAGNELREGDALFVGIASANRSRTLCAEPNVFNAARKPTRHLAFGHGPHYCLGAALARELAAEALKPLAAQIMDLHLSDQAVWEPWCSLRYPSGVTFGP